MEYASLVVVIPIQKLKTTHFMTFFNHLLVLCSSLFSNNYQSRSFSREQIGPFKAGINNECPTSHWGRLVQYLVELFLLHNLPTSIPRQWQCLNTFQWEISSCSLIQPPRCGWTWHNQRLLFVCIRNRSISESSLLLLHVSIEPSPFGVHLHLPEYSVLAMSRLDTATISSS